ncbi:hypothetical protein BKI52_12385 [marine bacterium AO1-C]|nr:hypothetical protein BKI52_12385 [marine bacterium AO1-C]
MKLFKSFRKKKKTKELDLEDLYEMHKSANPSEPSEEEKLLADVKIPPHNAEFDPETSPFAFIKTTFKIEEDQEVLIAERYYNSDEGLLYYKDFEAEPNFEKVYNYDEQGNLIEEVEISEGQVLTRDVFTYQENVTFHHLFISGELYEVKVDRTTSDGYVEVTFQNEFEIKRKEVKGTEPNYKAWFFDLGIMIEHQVHTYDEVENVTQIETYDQDEQLKVTSTKTYNDAGLLILQQAYEDKKRLILEKNYAYNEYGLVTKEENHDVFQDIVYTAKYEYDKQLNLIKMETHDASGRLVAFNINKFDHNNFLIEESVLSQGVLYHHKHVYEFKSKPVL